MTQFHFRTRDGVSAIESDVCDLPDIATARQTAVVFVGDMLRELGPTIYEDGLHVTVTNDAGDVCWDLRIDAVEGPGARRGDISA